MCAQYVDNLIDALEGRKKSGEFPNRIKFEKEGETVVGQVKAIAPNPWRTDKTVYHIQNLQDGEIYMLPSNITLMRLLEEQEAKVGDYVLVRYTGKSDTSKKGFRANLYEAAVIAQEEAIKKGLVPKAGIPPAPVKGQGKLKGPKVETSKDEEPTLDDLSLKELRARAKDLGVPRPRTLKRRALIKEIQKAEGEKVDKKGDLKTAVKPLVMTLGWPPQEAVNSVMDLLEEEPDLTYEEAVNIILEEEEEEDEDEEEEGEEEAEEEEEEEEVEEYTKDELMAASDDLLLELAESYEITVKGKLTKKKKRALIKRILKEQEELFAEEGEEEEEEEEEEEAAPAPQTLTDNEVKAVEFVAGIMEFYGEVGTSELNRLVNEVQGFDIKPDRLYEICNLKVAGDVVRAA